MGKSKVNDVPKSSRSQVSESKVDDKQYEKLLQERNYLAQKVVELE